MNIGMDFRGSINRLPGVLERVVARINTVWKKEHNPDGSHTNVSTSGDLVVGGDVSIEGGLEVEGPVNLGPNQYLDLKEYIPPSPPADTARLYALDVNGYTQVEMKDSAGRGVRFSSDNVIIAKISQAGGVYRGQAVFIAGAAGANSLVGLALSNSLSSMPAVGIVLDAGANNAFTRVLTSGTLQGVDTSAFAEGVPLFVSSTQPGGFTTVMPASPNFAQRVGFVTRSHATQGEILVLTTGTDVSGGGGGAGDVEYLGDYAPVTYNSGDIVVGPDGITYMCVKDGTTTPPEPWPAGANVPLPFHRTTHEPGGTDTIANVAWRNVENTFTQNQIIGKAIPRLKIWDTAQAVGSQKWEINSGGTNLTIGALNDAETAWDGRTTIDRIGNMSLTGTIKERNRTVPMGEWTAYTPTVTTSSGTVGQWASIHGAYMAVGKATFLMFDINGATIAGGPIVYIYITLPAGLALATPPSSIGTAVGFHAGGTWSGCLAYVEPGNLTRFVLHRGAAGFLNATDFYCWGQIVLPLA